MKYNGLGMPSKKKKNKNGGHFPKRGGGAPAGSQIFLNVQMGHRGVGGRGSDFKPKCPIILCPKVPREGGYQARMGQCLIFLFFFFFEGIPYIAKKLILVHYSNIHTTYIEACEHKPTRPKRVR